MGHDIARDGQEMAGQNQRPKNTNTEPQITQATLSLHGPPDNGPPNSMVPKIAETTGGGGGGRLHGSWDANYPCPPPPPCSFRPCR